MRVHPKLIVDAVISRLNERKDELVYQDKSIKSIFRIVRPPKKQSENSPAPPWVGVYFFLGSSNADISPDGTIADMPVTYGCLCCSSPGYQDEVESLDEAQAYAMLLSEIIPGDYEINVGTEENPDFRTVPITCSVNPFDVIEADPEMSLSTIEFNAPFQL